MSKAVLISIRPEWCKQIADGKKTIEVRKSKPKLPTPFKCYIYCTLPPRAELFGHGCIREYANELIRLQSGEIVYGYGMQLCCDTENRPYSKDNFLCKKVIGEFTCDRITYLGNISTDRWDLLQGSVHESNKQLVTEQACLTESDLLAYGGKYGWHISDLVIYDRPKELGEFQKPSDPNSFWYREVSMKRPPQSWCYVEELPKGGTDNA